MQDVDYKTTYQIKATNIINVAVLDIVFVCVSLAHTHIHTHTCTHAHTHTHTQPAISFEHVVFINLISPLLTPVLSLGLKQI